MHPGRPINNILICIANGGIIIYDKGGAKELGDERNHDEGKRNQATFDAG